MQKKVFFIGLLVGSIGLLNAGGLVDEVEPVVQGVQDAKPRCKVNAVYVDKKAQLMWQDSAYYNQEDDAYKREQSNAQAGNLAYAKEYCRALDYNGYTDWRLPSSDELMNLNAQEGVLVNNRGGDFWSSTKAKFDKYYVIYSVDGYRYERDATQTNYIRCVRCLTEASK